MRGLTALMSSSSDCQCFGVERMREQVLQPLDEVVLSALNCLYDPDLHSVYSLFSQIPVDPVPAAVGSALAVTRVIELCCFHSFSSPSRNRTPTGSLPPFGVWLCHYVSCYCQPFACSGIFYPLDIVHSLRSAYSCEYPSGLPCSASRIILAG